MRVLLWILDRCAGKADAVDSPIGFMPKPEDIDITDLDIDINTLKELLTVDKEVWLADVENQKEYFAQFGARLPKEIAEELARLENNLK